MLYDKIYEWQLNKSWLRVHLCTRTSLPSCCLDSKSEGLYEGSCYFWPLLWGFGTSTRCLPGVRKPLLLRAVLTTITYELKFLVGKHTKSLFYAREKPKVPTQEKLVISCLCNEWSPGSLPWISVPSQWKGEESEGSFMGRFHRSSTSLWSVHHFCLYATS